MWKKLLFRGSLLVGRAGMWGRGLSLGKLGKFICQLPHSQRDAPLRQKGIRSDRPGWDFTLAGLPFGVFTGGLPVLTGFAAFAGLTLFASLPGLTFFAGFAGGLAVLAGLTGSPYRAYPCPPRLQTGSPRLGGLPARRSNRCS